MSQSPQPKDPALIALITAFVLGLAIGYYAGFSHGLPKDPVELSKP